LDEPICAGALEVKMSEPVLLYDGVCGLCNRLVQFLLRRDRHDRLRFASLQSDFATNVLERYGRDPKDLDTVYVLVNRGTPEEQLLARSDAILAVVRRLGGIWKLAVAGKVVPRWIRDRLYDQVARNRYRVFGKYETCMLPEPKQRAKFLDL
jgi:predicted DCC family thiol-disulfide oxidoreductase YuxK